MKKLDFMVIGAQKSGTTALAYFLGQHPDICMAEPKEVHAFDHETYAGQWTDELLDEYYGGFFAHARGEPLLGEATPIYLFLPGAAEAISNWNPDIKLIVILRDPVERALSHYRMAVEQGYENLPFWLALLVEPLRRWLEAAPLAEHSSYRENSYRARGLYARQLHRFLKWFPRSQLMVLRTEDLRADHAATLSGIFRFLGVEPGSEIAPGEINTATDSGRNRYRFSRLLLRLSFWPDLLRLGRLVTFPIRPWLVQSQA